MGSRPMAHLSLNEIHPSPIKRALCRKLNIITGLKTFSSKCPLLPPIPIVTSFPITCAAIIVSASHWVGFTFPGMIEEPGSLSGIKSSPMPDRGPLARSRMSLAIFIRLTAIVFNAPCAFTIASCAASDSNLFSAVMNGSPDKVAI